MRDVGVNKILPVYSVIVERSLTLRMVTCRCPVGLTMKRRKRRTMYRHRYLSKFNAALSTAVKMLESRVEAVLLLQGTTEVLSSFKRWRRCLLVAGWMAQDDD